jgi:hypothetical protein
MKRVRKERLVGWLVLFIFIMSASWYFSQDNSRACILPPAEEGTCLNQYSTTLVNGASGISWFLQAMPDS